MVWCRIFFDTCSSNLVSGRFYRHLWTNSKQNTIRHSPTLKRSPALRHLSSLETMVSNTNTDNSEVMTNCHDVRRMNHPRSIQATSWNSFPPLSIPHRAALLAEHHPSCGFRDGQSAIPRSQQNRELLIAVLSMAIDMVDEVVAMDARYEQSAGTLDGLCRFSPSRQWKSPKLKFKAHCWSTQIYGRSTSSVKHKCLDYIMANLKHNYLYHFDILTTYDIVKYDSFNKISERLWCNNSLQCKSCYKQWSAVFVLTKHLSWWSLVP